ncbi:MAG: hypothetical protein ACK4OH_14015 [Acidovorax temperans]|uniref:hypothetical protein n=1 Tax=Acidovorax temperans TaxID=80878 RepID=UPI0039191C2D
MKIIGYLLLVLGIGIGIFAYSMDTTVEAGGQTFGSGEFMVNVPKSRVHNVGLMEDRRLLFYAAGLSLVLGTAFLGIATLSSGKLLVANQAAPMGESKASLAERFASGAPLSADEVRELADLAVARPNLCQLASRTNGDSLLHVAARRGISDAAETLLRAGASRSQRNGNGQTAFQLAKEDKLAELLRPEL